MKASVARRWKLKERQYNQKYKLKSNKRAAQTKDFSGKFLFLLSKSNLCTVLKFLSRNVCITAAVITINPLLIRQISPKYFLSSRRNKRLIAQSEVRITRRFKDCYKRLLDVGKGELLTEASKKITPIKIVSCKVCKTKLIETALEHHIATAHGSQKSESSTEDELYIDDDVELLLDGALSTLPSSTSAPPEDRPHECLQCPETFATETLLLDHIDSVHPIKLIKRLSNDKLLPSTSTSKRRSQEQTPAPSTPTIAFKRFESKSEFICRICSTQFVERSHLNRHVVSLHVSKVFRCYRCQVSYDKFFSIKKHLLSAHANFANEVEYEKSFTNPDAIALHQCCFCKFASKSRGVVDSHLMNEHYEDFEKPELLEENVSTSPDSLDELMLPETRAKLDNSINQNAEEEEEEELLTELVTANDKLRKSTNDPSFPYRCARCLKRFSRSNWLKRHPCKMKVEVEAQPPKRPKISNEVNGFLKCTFKPCNKVFTDRKHFNDHIESHTA